jgi:hypothetical protein
MPGWRLPRGRYHLTLIADGEATVDLHLSEIRHTRSSKIVPTDKVQSSLQGFRPEPYTGDVLFSAGEENPVAKADVALVSYWLEGKDLVAETSGMCEYGSAPPPSPATYLPPCPSGEGTGELSINDHLDPGEFRIEDMRLWSGAIPEALGAYYANASTLESSGAIIFWLDLS